MKRASMRFWLCANLCAFLSSPAFAQWPPRLYRIDHKYSSRPIRSHELTLAGLRPGKSTKTRANAALKSFGAPRSEDLASSWFDADSCEKVNLDFDINGILQTIHLTINVFNGQKTCQLVPPGAGWKTGRGLSLRASCPDVIKLYGEPDSRSPSTKNSQPLELLYYAFDWAGPDVPQVMEVVCTAEKGKPSQVVEITLARGSL